MAVLFPLEIYTPHRIFFSDSVEAIILTLIDGEAEICASHNPFAAPIVPCLLKIKTRNGIWRTAFSSEGILEVNTRKTIIVSDAAEWPEEIDHERAIAAKKKAENTIASTTAVKFETNIAAAALKRADMRIKARGERK
jgi:F-type H+-transporting ATPase subunit epsilon